jgi:23S rRNA (cytosine1962-C5)-methyltransferase
MQHVVGGHELIDAGDDRRLERFGSVLVDRPAPTAAEPRRDVGTWEEATARYESLQRGGRGRWILAGSLPDPWRMELAGCTLELRPTEAGQVGAFPEHAEHWPWLRERVTERLHDGPVEVLDLFAYTGGATLAAAAAGAQVVHVDGSRPTVGWARRNAELSGLADRPIRWLVDDAGAFVAREVRRGRRYAGLVLDPPSYGHGPRGEPWHLGEDLDDLLATAAGLLAPDAFVLLTAHTPTEDATRLAGRLAVLRHGDHAGTECGELGLHARSGAWLPLGAWARIGGPR